MVVLALPGMVFSWVGAEFLAVSAVLLAAAFPAIGLFLSIATDGISLPILLLTPSKFPLAAWLVAIAVSLSAIGVAFQNSEARRRLVIYGSPMIILILWGTVGAYSTISLIQVATGIRFAFLPLLVGIVACGVSPRSIERILLASGAVLLVNVVATIFELRLGTAWLISLGLKYGGPVRTFESVLRPPGLFLANYLLGGFAAVLTVILIARLSVSGRHMTRLQAGLSVLVLGISIVAVVQSTSRFAVIVLSVGISAVMLSRQRLIRGIRLVAIVLVCGIVLIFVDTGWGSGRSLVERLSVWTDVLNQVNFMTGSGWGTAGSATLSRYASERTTVDNYFLSLLYQIGIIGPILIVVAFGALIKAVARSGRLLDPLRFAGACATLGIVASFAVTETWEYTSAACLAMVCLGARSEAYLARSDSAASDVSARLVQT